MNLTSASLSTWRQPAGPFAWENPVCSKVSRQSRKNKNSAHCIAVVYPAGKVYRLIPGLSKRGTRSTKKRRRLINDIVLLQCFWAGAVLAVMFWRTRKEAIKAIQNNNYKKNMIVVPLISSNAIIIWRKHALLKLRITIKLDIHEIHFLHFTQLLFLWPGKPCFNCAI